jgi:hypothetical protein
VKWGKPTTRNEITDLHRIAVKQLGEKREWVYQQTAIREVMPVCKACGESQKILDAAICWNCKNIISKKRAKELGIEDAA